MQLVNRRRSRGAPPIDVRNSRHRSPGGGRPAAGYSNRGRVNGRRSSPERHQLAGGSAVAEENRRKETMMKAGRLATEYLVSVGLLPADVLSGRSKAGEAEVKGPSSSGNLTRDDSFRKRNFSEDDDNGDSYRSLSDNTAPKSDEGDIRLQVDLDLNRKERTRKRRTGWDKRPIDAGIDDGISESRLALSSRDKRSAGSYNFDSRCQQRQIGKFGRRTTGGSSERHYRSRSRSWGSGSPSRSSNGGYSNVLVDSLTATDLEDGEWCPQQKNSDHGHRSKRRPPLSVRPRRNTLIGPELEDSAGRGGDRCSGIMTTEQKVSVSYSVEQKEPQSLKLGQDGTRSNMLGDDSLVLTWCGKVPKRRRSTFAKIGSNSGDNVGAKVESVVAAAKCDATIVEVEDVVNVMASAKDDALIVNGVGGNNFISLNMDANDHLDEKSSSLTNVASDFLMKMTSDSSGHRNLTAKEIIAQTSDCADTPGVTQILKTEVAAVCNVEDAANTGTESVLGVGEKMLAHPSSRIFDLNIAEDTDTIEGFNYSAEDQMWTSCEELTTGPNISTLLTVQANEIDGDSNKCADNCPVFLMNNMENRPYQELNTCDFPENQNEMLHGHINSLPDEPVHLAMKDQHHPSSSNTSCTDVSAFPLVKPAVRDALGV